MLNMIGVSLEKYRRLVSIGFIGFSILFFLLVFDGGIWVFVGITFFLILISIGLGLWHSKDFARKTAIVLLGGLAIYQLYNLSNVVYLFLVYQKQIIIYDLIAFSITLLISVLIIRKISSKKMKRLFK
tara:strand:+ start:518 stop:901 length:384 start_codon:yes stop_codon:yes gene_type:complete